MAKYRHSLPQLGGGFFLTDGGIETALRKYFRTYAALAKRFGAGLLLESATWRANADWGARLGYTGETLAKANRKAIRLLEEIQGEFENEKTKIVISGCIGPRGDGYNPVHTMSEKDAKAYHREQIETFASTAADMVAAITMNYVEEAVGITQAARDAGMPASISFTVETDGRLVTGQTLKAAIEQVDAATSSYPCYYMINCAHPAHFEHVLTEGEAWVNRIRGLRANASIKSHAELNESPELDIGNPTELAMQHARLKKRFGQLNVMGGCCGTDHRHVEQIAEACSSLFRVGA